jgi:ornithine cyclodeaminase/alanine dehydrogenase-like protein (mu-crystallin family)
MSTAIELVEDAFRDLGEGTAENRSRTRIPLPHGLFHFMGASLLSRGVVGMKAYASTHAGTTFLVSLFDTNSGQILALFEADWLGRIRTGAASGVATRLLSRENSRVAGVIGTGGQALTQVEALATVRPLDTVKVFGRHPERRRAFAHTLRGLLDTNIVEVSSAREAVDGSDIVTAVTSARAPVVEGAWLAPGTHVNAAGANALQRRELDLMTVERAACIVTDSLDQARIECADLVAAVEAGSIAWDDVRELGDLLAGGESWRSSDDDITLFESQGIALEDVAVAKHIYEAALQSGRGESVVFGGSG